MTENGKPVGWITMREMLIIASLLVPALAGFIKTQSDVNSIKESFVSHDQLQIEVQKALNISGLQAANIVDLTNQVKVNNEQVEALTIELKAMRAEWANYRGHR